MASTTLEVIFKGKDGGLGSMAGSIGGKFGKMGAVIGGGLVAGAALGGAALVGLGAAALGVEDDVRQATNALIVGTGASGEALDAMRQSVINLGGSVQSTGHDMTSIGGTMAEVNTRLGVTGDTLEGLTGEFLTFTRLAGGDATENVRLVTRVMGDWGVANEDASGTMDALFGASQAFGVGVDQVAQQVVQFGAPLRQMGFSLEESIALFGKWEKEGVNAELAVGSLRIAAGNFARDNIPLQDGLRDTMAAIIGATSESEALAIAMDVFGARAGPDMAAAIREGRFELDGAIEALQATQGNLEAAGDATIGYRDRASAAWREVTLALLPLGDGLADLADEFMPMVTEFVTGTLVPTLGVAMTWLKDHLPAAIQILSDYWTNVLKPAIEAVWGFLNATAIPYLQNVVIPFLQVFVPAALKFLSNVWENVLLPAIEAVWAWMEGTLMPFLQNTVFPWLQEKIPAALQTLSDFWTNTLLPAIEGVWKFLTQDMMPIWEALEDLLGVVVPLALEVLQGVWENVLLPAMEDVWEFLTENLGPAFEWLKDKVLGPVTSSFDGLGGKIQDVAGFISGLTDKLRDIKLPAWLTPGSPTPWEIGLRGISRELEGLYRGDLPALNMQLQGLQATSQRTTNVSQITNIYTSAVDTRGESAASMRFALGGI